MEIKHHTMLAIIAIATLSSASAWAEDNTLEVRHQGVISYVSGGIGDEETAALKSTKHNYNLSIMNADKSGHYSGDSRIVISDLKHNVLLDATSGPIFYANLPKGRYIVEGFVGAQSKKQAVTIVNGKPAHIRFVWPQDSTE